MLCRYIKQCNASNVRLDLPQSASHITTFQGFVYLNVLSQGMSIALRWFISLTTPQATKVVKQGVGVSADKFCNFV